MTDEVKERIEKEAEERVPKLLCDSTHNIGTISVNTLEASIRIVAVENQIEGAKSEYLRAQDELQSQRELLYEMWSLWESLAECGELSIGPNFSKNYDRLKEKYHSIKSKEA